jgi:hypothetical protein
LTKKDRIDGAFNFQSRNSNQAQLYQFTDVTDGSGLRASIGWTHNFSPRLFDALRWTFSRNRNETLPFFAYGSNVAAQLGINGTSQDPINYGPPNVSFTNFGNLNDASPLLNRQQVSS